MPLDKSRSQKRDEERPKPFRPSKVLLRALNNELSPKFQKHVDPRALLLLVKRFQQLEEALASAGDVKVIDGSPYNTPELSKRYMAVNRILHRYHVSPIILPLWYSGDEVSEGWSFHWRRVGNDSQPFMEVNIALQIERIAASGRITSLKQCEQCSKWLFARFPHQRFCSAKCKEVFHRTDPADRQRRREWAKENYRIHKTKNVK